MNQMNLPSFNPLNIVGHGAQKVNHPTTGYSNVISQNVEGMYKEFTGSFHTNLRNLVMLYKTRHQLLESLNENKFVTAKCYKEMFDGTPLSEIVSHGESHSSDHSEKNENAITSSATAPMATGNTVSLEDGVHTTKRRTSKGKSYQELHTSIEPLDEIDTPESGYPDSGVIMDQWDRMDPDEGSMIATEFSKNLPTKEPEGMKASRNVSTNASGASFLATVSDRGDGAVDDRGTKRDPPSAASVSRGGSIAEANYNRRESTDPPPTGKSFPGDETVLSVEKNDLGQYVALNEMGGNLNYIVDDDDDSFTFEKVSREKALEGEVWTKEKEDIVGVCDQISKAKIMATDEGHTKVKEIEDKKVNEEGCVPFTAFSSDEIDDGSMGADGNSCSSESSAKDEKGGNDDSEYLNISNDGELVVFKAAPEKDAQSAMHLKQTMDHSYFDVHKASFEETKAKLDEHSDLVDYVTEWEQTVVKRVQSRYFEYVKHRNSLNHYSKKVGSLLDEEDKLREKNKPMKPKQKEKLERNQVKLTGAQETHDKAGESLLMLMDEVVHRSWRDVFPLLTRSLAVEVDFATIQQKHMAKLTGTLLNLESIGESESISGDGRLISLQNMNPEDIFTGSRRAYSQK